MSLQNLFFAGALSLFCTAAYAQTDPPQQFKINGHLHDSSWFRYEKGQKVLSVLPIISGVAGNGRVMGTIGLSAEAGYFPLNRLMTSVKISSQFVHYPFIRSSNQQNLELGVKYFFTDKTCITPYVGGSLGMTRLQYTPTPEFSYMNDPAGQRTVHLLPYLSITVGASIKVSNQFSFQLGISNHLPLYNYNQSTGTGNPVHNTQFSRTIGIQYHFR